MMAEAQTNAEATPHRKYQAGVAKRLDTILAEIEDLRGAVTAVLAERQAEQMEKRRNVRA